MKLFNKVVILGMGLIGGSLALAIKKNKLAPRITGFSRHRGSLVIALKRKAIDYASHNFKDIKDADLVVFATPVCTTLSLAKKLSKVVNKDCIVTDVGSTKQEVDACLGKIFANFVGSHPLAGSEKRGIANADVNIFNGSLCVLTKGGGKNNAAVMKIKRLWEVLGCKVIILTAKEHDRMLSFTSHLPHAVAFSLINAIPARGFMLASSGLKDTTRIAASDSGLWSDIFVTNRKNILKSLHSFEKNLRDIKTALRKNDKNRISLLIKKAQGKRKILG